MLSKHIALTSDGDGPGLAELASVAAALQKQVSRDLHPIWGVTGTVDSFPELEDVPVDYWPIIVTGRELGTTAGIHLDERGLPYALIHAGPNWSVHASSACLDILVNPSEQQLCVGASPRGEQSVVEFLVDISAPCGFTQAYAINEVVVSDFSTPAFFGLELSAARRYSQHGSLVEAFCPAPGGHIAWREPSDDAWWLRTYWDEPTDTRLGQLVRSQASLRELIRAHAAARRSSQRALIDVARSPRAHAQASSARAARLRALFNAAPRAASGPTAPNLDSRYDSTVLPPRPKSSAAGRRVRSAPTERLGYGIDVQVGARELEMSQAEPESDAIISRPQFTSVPPPIARTIRPSYRNRFDWVRQGSLVLGGVLVGGLAAHALRAERSNSTLAQGAQPVALGPLAVNTSQPTTGALETTQSPATAAAAQPEGNKSCDNTSTPNRALAKSSAKHKPVPRASEPPAPAANEAAEGTDSDRVVERLIESRL